ncbi:hypothetical protein BJV78DRAFT_1287056 [Lactifluus subvellereus]|nr:hypothetical protein BJV78DRAFT_1287056 [Lactifluus subvellereus]
MASLPLGVVPHPTDTYNVTALLTAAKSVIVGLKPTPKTWYRRHRDEDDEQMGKGKFRAALAWFPSVVPGAPPPAAARTNAAPAKKDGAPTTLMLVYSLGSTLRLLLVSELKTLERFTSQRTGKVTAVEVGRLVFEEKARWNARDIVHAIQWFNAKQILAVTASALEVYDVQTRALVEHVHFDPGLLLSPSIGHTINGRSHIRTRRVILPIACAPIRARSSFSAVTRDEPQVGTLLTWADRILSFVESGDFLSAIDLTRSYYLGTAPGNKDGLPEDPLELKKVVGEKMRELMVASTRYTFSEDRMTDGTHHTPDGRGVDRTSLFENLVATCAPACIALGDLEFLFEDIFQAYDDAGIAPIYLEQFETFVLEHDVRAVDPRITQRLIALHSANGGPDRAEHVIWHTDPACLDIDQVAARGRNDRQLAAEYLLSVYTPHESERLLRLFEDGGFYRILSTWYRQEGRWSALLLAHLHDPDVHPPELFASADEIFAAAAAAASASAAREPCGSVSHDDDDLRATVATALPELLNASIRWGPTPSQTLRLLALSAQPAVRGRRRASDLVAVAVAVAVAVGAVCGRAAAASQRVHRAAVQDRPRERHTVPEDDALRTCEEHEVFDAVVWAIDWRGDAGAALEKVEVFGARLSAAVGGLLARSDAACGGQQPQRHLESLEAIGRTGVAICIERSSSKQAPAATEDDDAPVEELPFRGVAPPPAAEHRDDDDDEEGSPALHTLTTLRSLVQTTFSPLVSASAARGRGVSFPRLFTRRVETTTTTASTGAGHGTRYTEFRTILTEAYRAEGDMLVITERMLDRDVFETVEMAARVGVAGGDVRGVSAAAANACEGKGTRTRTT